MATFQYVKKGGGYGNFDATDSTAALKTLNTMADRDPNSGVQAVNQPATAPAAPSTGTGTNPPPNPIVASSDELHQAELKKEQDAKKAQADKDAELARLTQEKQIADLRASLAPETPKPGDPNFTGDYKTLRGEKDAAGNSVDDYQSQLVDNRKKAAEITDSLNNYRAGASAGQPESTFLSTMDEKTRNAKVVTDKLDREALILQNQISNRTDVINTLMGLKKDDYTTASARYDKDFANNVTIQTLLNNKQNQQQTLEEKAKDNARANLQIIQGEIKSGNLDFDTLDPVMKTTIDNLETQAGLPKGFTAYVTANVKGDVVSTNTRTTNGGDQYYDVLSRDANGKFSVTSIYAGAAKGGSSDDEQKQIDAFGKATSEAIIRMDKEGTDYDTEFRALKAQFPQASDALIHAKLGAPK